jgi:HSP20 family protein
MTHKKVFAMGEKLTAVRAAKKPESIKRVPFDKFIDRMDSTFQSISRRAYEIFENDGRVFGHNLEHWTKAEKELLHSTQIEMTEMDSAFQVKAEVPGFTNKELEIGIAPRRLLITGKRQTKSESKKGKTIYSETSSDEIMRIIDLPADVEAEKINATLKNGVLELNLPKAVKSRNVPIQMKAA